MSQNLSFPSPGASAGADGTRFHVWAPDRGRVEVILHSARDASQPARTILLERDAAGFHSGLDPAGRAGDLYKYRLDGDDAQTFPDPASRRQPEGVHGPSEVQPAADAGQQPFPWAHEAGRSDHALADLVIYELHIGTFTPEGTFRAAIARLPHLADLGVTAVEIMPLADFPGRWNWGYDGVALFAPARCYGTPDDLRALVDAAHGHGLRVILDAVYNHLGPDGNYLSAYAKDYFNPRHKTPWGDALNFDGPNAGPVRAFFLANIAYWLDQFHFDGLRLDATHALIDDSPRHILAELTAAAHARGAFVFAEDERNEAQLARPEEAGGSGLDGLWADDFHHVVRVALTGERDSYFGNYEGSAAELRDTLAHGWTYRGQAKPTDGETRGTECADLPPAAFCYCISNHDQVGNRALGQRLTADTTPAAYRAASALLLLSPYTPMLFMGQEWAASTPFLFFTDHNAELGRLVTEGRRKEFAGFAAFRDPANRASIPDPQADATFLGSKLVWQELEEPAHAATLALYRTALSLRRDDAALRWRARGQWEVLELGPGVSAIHYRKGDERALVVFALAAGQTGDLPAGDGADWRVVFSSNAPEFGGEGGHVFDPGNRTFRFDQPEVLVLRTP